MSSDDVTHEGDMPQQGPGQVLAEARSALAISIEETAEILNLPVRVIKAIEENDADKLPDDVYVYGYIRAYAKLMGLAGDPLIKAWTAHHSEVDPLDSASTGTGHPIGVPGGIESSEPPKMGRWFAIAMVLSAFFVAFEEIRLPLLEYTELFARGVGEATDIVEKEMYTLADRMR